jgi:hypothetical protein
MAKREIVDCFERSTGASIARYVWRSKPIQSPHTGRAVRGIVAQDENGRYWSGTRVGPGKSAKAEYEFWLHPSRKINEAVAVARDHTRGVVEMEAELYARTITDKKPGEEIVKVTMDDGWSVAINAPDRSERITPGFTRLMNMLNGYEGNTKPQDKSQRIFDALDSKGKGKKTPPEGKPGRGWPSR